MHHVCEATSRRNSLESQLHFQQTCKNPPRLRHSVSSPGNCCRLYHNFKLTQYLSNEANIQVEPCELNESFTNVHSLQNNACFPCRHEDLKHSSMSSSHLDLMNSCHTPHACTEHMESIYAINHHHFQKRGSNCICKTLEKVSLDTEKIYCKVDYSLSAKREILKLSECGVTISGWYYGKLSSRDAEQKLQNASVGSFIVRESSDARFRYSLSVQTTRGPTSVRIQQCNKGVSLDSDPGSKMLTFICMHHLLEYYISSAVPRNASNTPTSYSRADSGSTSHQDHVWLDSNGFVVSAITLAKPYRERVPTLKHLARLAINKARLDTTSLPHNLQLYLNVYPFWC